MKKKIISVALASSLVLVSVSAGAFAASNLESIKAFLNLGIKFTVDGESWIPVDSSGKKLYPITYNNTTYLPIRAAGEALGVDIQWDQTNNTVRLGDKNSSSNTSSQKDNSSIYSRKNPAPLNTTVSFKVNDYLDNYSGEVSISDYLRGEEAWKLISAANIYNEAPSEGYEYMLVKVNFKVISNEVEDKAVSVSGFDFDLVSAEGKDYEKPFVVEPEPVFDATLYEGASASGWVAFSVKKGDKPTIAFARNYDGTGGVWFKLE